nr:GAF domain-containing sensor histidine kinase [uncultured Methanoregula sp.]
MAPDADLQRVVERMQRVEALSGTGSWDYVPATGSIWISEETARILGISRPADGIALPGQAGSAIPGWEPLKQGFDSLTDPGNEFNILFSIDPSETSRKMINAAGILVAGSPGGKPHITGMVKEVTSSSTFLSDLPAQVNSIMNTTGLESLDRTCQLISTWLDADCVMIGEILPDGEQVNVLSMILRGKIVRGSTYCLKNTPCENVTKKGFCLYPEHASELFPESRDLSELGIQGYLGIPLRSHNGEIMGVLCALTCQPLHPPSVIRHFIELVAPRAAAEIERRRAEEELTKNQVLLANAMDLAHMACWEYDPATRLFIFDDRFFALYGTTAEREGGRYMAPEVYAREFIHPDDRAVISRAMQTTMNSADPEYTVTLQHRMLRRDGEIRDLIVRIGIARDPAGKIIRSYGANQDITEMKQAERALRQANQKISLLSSITRHDILNQITVIRAYFRNARKKVADPVVTEYIDRMDNVAQKIQSQINFTRVYQDLGTDSPRWIVLEETMPAVPDTLRFDTDLKNLAVYADPMFMKVFSNLLDNSVRHGGHVTAISVSVTKEGETATILWEDDGEGIAAEEKSLIFEHGYGRNTGLGLSLAREILAITGITIIETGIPGEGARFEIRVPKGAYR